MNFFNFDLKKLVMIILVLALPLLSINQQQRAHESNWLSKPFSLLGSSLSEAFYGFSAGVKDTTGLYLNLINIKKQSLDTLTLNNDLKSRLTKMDELLIENDRLRSLLDFKANTKMTLVAAQVIGRDLMLDHNTITINKGTDDGLKAGQAVITTQGAFGYIYKPENYTSSVLLIFDRYSVVDGIVQRTRAHGIVEGKNQSTSTLQLKYVERGDDVQEGDLVVTGGLDNIFPKGFPIAIVERVEKKTFNVSLTVDLKPIVDPYKVEEVFIITQGNNEDFGDRFALPGTSTETEAKTEAAPATVLPTATTVPPAAPAATAKPATAPQEIKQ